MYRNLPTRPNLLFFFIAFLVAVLYALLAYCLLESCDTSRLTIGSYFLLGVVMTLVSIRDPREGIKFNFSSILCVLVFSWIMPVFYIYDLITDLRQL